MPHIYPYIRVSHKDSAASGISPESQLDVFRRWFNYEKSIDRLPDHSIAERGWQGGPDLDEFGRVRRDNLGIPKRIDADRTDGAFVDMAASAYKKKFLQRPAGGRLNLALSDGDIVWFYNVNRAFRDTEDGRRMERLWRRRGITLVFHESGIQTRTAEGLFFFTILLANAELDSGWKSEHQRELKAAAKAAGMPTNQRRPLGFTMKGKADLEEREVMKAIVAVRHHRHPLPTKWTEVSDIIERELAAKENRKPRFAASPTPRFWSPSRCRTGYGVALARGWAQLPPGVTGDYSPTQRIRRA